MPLYLKPDKRFVGKMVPDNNKIDGLREDDGKARYAIDAAASKGCRRLAKNAVRVRSLVRVGLVGFTSERPRKQGRMDRILVI